MGSRGRGALAASVLGSVSHFALNHNSVPVLIVHSRDGESSLHAADGESDVHVADGAAPVAEAVG
jgi:Universal stress protein family